MNYPVTRRSQLNGLGASLISDVASGIARGSVKSVTFRSQISPDYSYDPNAPIRPGGGGFGQILMQIVKPEVEVDTAAGRVSMAPWGKPTLPLFPLAVGVVILGAAAVAGLVVRGLRK